MKLLRKLFRYILISACVIIFCVTIKTAIDFHSPATNFKTVNSGTSIIQVLDRNGKPLSVTYQNTWNTYNITPLYNIPEFLQQAFITAEDKRFYNHHGVDWLARSNALFAHITGHAGRGASTITEQVVRMLNPRPRNYWNKWVEGWEAISLEAHINKPEILEFYLNQVPYASNRRGVTQAAKFYFNRDITTLNPKEMLALAVLVRSPSRYDLYKKHYQYKRCDRTPC